MDPTGHFFIASDEGAWSSTEPPTVINVKSPVIVLYGVKLDFEGPEMPESTPAVATPLSPLIFFSIANQVLADCKPDSVESFPAQEISFDTIMTYSPTTDTGDFAITINSSSPTCFYYEPEVIADNSTRSMSPFPAYQSASSYLPRSQTFSTSISISVVLISFLRVSRNIRGWIVNKSVAIFS